MALSTRRWLGWLFLPMALLAQAHDGGGGKESPPGQSFPVGPAISGSWFDPSRNGEGFILEYFPDGTAIAAWFTYPASGESGEQTWLIAQGSQIANNVLRFEQVFRTTGGKFGDAFDPGAIQNVPWGTLEIVFTDCSHATALYSGPAAYGSGTRSLTRLTTLAEIDCNGSRALTSTNARAMDGLQTRSGPWFVASRSGEGWFLEELPGGSMVVYWFTFDPAGNQAWTVGSGVRQGNRLVIPGNTITRGTRFGADFNPAAIENRHWGQLEFTFTSCNTAQVSYTSTVAGYGSGQREATRLTTLAGAPCLNEPPAARTGGNWQEQASMPPNAQSELAVAVLGDYLYALGGFGDQRAFKRYDLRSNSWSRLPDMPSGRNHHAAFAADGGVYFVGGERRNGDDGTAQAYRFDLAAGRWDPVTTLSYTFGSHAAMLNGRAYIGRGDGALEEFDPKTGLARRIAPPTPAVSRDHSQVVAFLDEIWMLGGRTPETASTAIYDPVSSRWRVGPPMQAKRGGFGAAVVDNQIIVGGGEVLSGNVRLEPTVEVLTAGSDVWRFGPPLALAVHGVAAGAYNGQVYFVGGSVNASSASGSTARVFAWRPQ
ncbi:Kelch repeat-containing protein [Tahibacter amnicola]|uniref:N-acetylneuraminic acid mutarotase n=1 Tax=Tahibacter amnicola TaxID=2976241 RepID=A0ABY6BDV8_9GAMM|nr:kelch repeat-containing protein [Tahibacter amnicola]UXI68024.1 hypothetical protein N4264_25415 [Tahibacter amnicola]